MIIRAILQKGVIRPLEPIPPDWADGQELLIEEPKPEAREEISQWARELDAASGQIPAEEHERFLKALDEIECESKEAVRRQWGQP